MYRKAEIRVCRLLANFGKSLLRGYMSEYAKLTSQGNIHKLEELNIFLRLDNPLSDPLTINWEIKFPFPIDSGKKTTGTVLLPPHDNQVFSWITVLSQLPSSKREEVAEKEIVVELSLTHAGNATRDGLRSTLKQLDQR